jgi:hypothetical protein
LSAPEVPAIIGHCFTTRAAVARDLVLEEFNRFPAVFAGDIEDGIRAPLLCVVAGAFSHSASLHRCGRVSLTTEKTIAKAVEAESTDIVLTPYGVLRCITQ